MATSRLWATPPYRPDRATTWPEAFYNARIDGLPVHDDSDEAIEALLEFHTMEYDGGHVPSPYLRFQPFGQNNWNSNGASGYYSDVMPPEITGDDLAGYFRTWRHQSLSASQCINAQTGEMDRHYWHPSMRQQNSSKDTTEGIHLLLGLPYMIGSHGDRHSILWVPQARALVECIGFMGTHNPLYPGSPSASGIVTWDLDNYVLPMAYSGTYPAGVTASRVPIAPFFFTYQDLMDAAATPDGDLGHALAIALANYHGPGFRWPLRESDGTGGPGPLLAGSYLRLRADFPVDDLPTDWLKALARTMQRYGLLIYDKNHRHAKITTCNDPAWPSEHSPHFFDDRDLFHLENFEMVDATPITPANPHDMRALSLTYGLDEDPPANVAPTAVAAAAPTSGDAPLEVTFTGSGSSDSDGSIVAYGWDFDDGGTADTANPTHTYTDPGVYTATLTVTDDDGATDTDTVNVTVTEEVEPPGDLTAAWVGVTHTAGGTDVSFVPPLPAGTQPGDRLILFVANPATVPTDGGGWTVARNQTHAFNPGLRLVVLTGVAGAVSPLSGTVAYTTLVAVRGGTGIGATVGGGHELPGGIAARSHPDSTAGVWVGMFWRNLNTGTLALSAVNDGVVRGTYENRAGWYSVAAPGDGGTVTGPAWSHGATPNTIPNSQYVWGAVLIEGVPAPDIVDEDPDPDPGGGGCALDPHWRNNAGERVESNPGPWDVEWDYDGAGNWSLTFTALDEIVSEFNQRIFIMSVSVDEAFAVGDSSTVPSCMTPMPISGATLTTLSGPTPTMVQRDSPDGGEDPNGPTLTFVYPQPPEEVVAVPAGASFTVEWSIDPDDAECDTLMAFFPVFGETTAAAPYVCDGSGAGGGTVVDATCELQGFYLDAESGSIEAPTGWTDEWSYTDGHWSVTFTATDNLSSGIDTSVSIFSMSASDGFDPLGDPPPCSGLVPMTNLTFTTLSGPEPVETLQTDNPEAGTPSPIGWAWFATYDGTIPAGTQFKLEWDVNPAAAPCDTLITSFGVIDVGGTYRYVLAGCDVEPCTPVSLPIVPFPADHPLYDGAFSGATPAEGDTGDAGSGPPGWVEDTPAPSHRLAYTPLPPTVTGQLDITATVAATVTGGTPNGTVVLTVVDLDTLDLVGPAMVFEDAWDAPVTHTGSYNIAVNPGNLAVLWQFIVGPGGNIEWHVYDTDIEACTGTAEWTGDAQWQTVGGDPISVAALGDVVAFYAEVDPATPFPTAIQAIFAQWPAGVNADGYIVDNGVDPPTLTPWGDDLTPPVPPLSNGTQWRVAVFGTVISYGTHLARVTLTSPDQPTQLSLSDTLTATGPPQPVVTRGQLGACGLEHYTAALFARGGTVRLTPLDGLTAVHWGRDMDTPAPLSVTLAVGAASCRDLLDQFADPWAAELRIYRRGQPVAEGPVFDVRERPGERTVEIEAQTVSVWLEHRQVRQTIDAEAVAGRNSVRFAEQVIRAGFSRDDPNVLPFLHVVATGAQRIDKTVDPTTTPMAASELADVAEHAVDWTEVGRRIIVMPAGHHLARIGHLDQSHIDGDWELSRSGADYWSLSTVVGEGDLTATRGGISPRYGLVERVHRADSLTSLEAVEAVAEGAQAPRPRPPVRVNFDDDVALRPTAPVTIEELVPGAVFPASFTNGVALPVTQDFRLQRVSVDVTREDGERVSVSAEAVGYADEGLVRYPVFVALGDSLTSVNADLVRTVSHRWHDLVATSGLVGTRLDGSRAGNTSQMLRDTPVVAPRPADLTVVFLGANDVHSVASAFPDVTPAEYEANLHWFLDSYPARRQVLVFPWRWDETAAGEGFPPTEETYQSYRERAQAVAAARQVPLVDLGEMVPDAYDAGLTVDAIHPNVLGHEFIANAVMAVI